ncbi:lysylphosphatidylglycerol synthase transmembrane domain-containing protein [uncultured Thiodictyon sp.]|uniref:lysylphosphatidylglycerol synthase transmembrane domain-containing protein n=1 Tax=uncultured Thiodictyon sp. TaxID=1846217 RepID=UPI0025F06A0E|nr:lysylphosphatidylglycerol synthase transmembrane domain-containing protein [uncultured Thiodictyon sp.]
MSKRRLAIRTSILVSFALSALFLWLAFRQVDLGGLVRTFAAISLPPVLLSAVALAGSMVLRALRWRLIAGLPRDRHRPFARATYLGVLVNLLLPGRVGEFLRVVTLARLTGSTLALPLASAVIDRLVDVVVLIACAGGLYFALPLDRALDEWLIYLLIGTAVLAAALLFFVKGARFWEERVATLTERWLQRWSLRPDVFLSELRHELHGLLRGWMTLEVALVAVVIVACDYLAVGSLFLAFAIPLSLAAPLLVLVCLGAGSALPSAPGYVGIYQAAAVVALAFFGQPAESAIALATILQLLTLAVALLMNGRGAIGMVRQARPQVTDSSPALSGGERPVS